MTYSYLSCRYGFSLAEMIIATGMFAGLIYLGAQSLTSHVQEDRVQEQRTEALHMVRHKHFSVNFLDVMKRSAVSMDYTKLFVNYTNNCTTKDNGPCFFTLNKKGIRGAFDSNLVKSPRGQGIHFFSDRILSPQRYQDNNNVYIKKAVGTWRYFMPKKARYAKKLLASKDQRYFAGWSLKDTDKKHAFYIMSSPKTKMSTFQVSNPSGRTITDEGAKYNYKSLVLPNNPEEFEKNFAEIKSDYENRYYLAYYSLIPEMHYIIKIKSFMSCKNGNKLKKECKEVLDSAAPNRNTDAEKERHEIHLNHYLVELSKCTIMGCSQFFKEFPNNRGNRTGFFGVPASEFNFFFIDKFSVDLTKDSPGDPDYADLMLLQKPSQNPHFFANLPVMVGVTRVAEVIMYPLQFNRFYLEQSGDAKKLIMESYDSVSDPNNTHSKKRVVVKALNKEAKVVFARKLGSAQFSAFIFDHKKKSQPPPDPGTQ
ncbi:MAG: hypothetical protein OXC40_04580 [Proteobacteria bacterium]|nr:hypothetical protein [Pseudomonadota bacterium]